MGKESKDAKPKPDTTAPSGADSTKRNASAARASAEYHLKQAHARASAIDMYHSACDVIDECKTVIAENMHIRDKALMALRDNDMSLMDIAEHTGMSASYIGVRLKTMAKEDKIQ